MDRPQPEVLISADELDARVSALADDISRAFEGVEIVAMPLLKGAFVFAADLLRRIRGGVSVEFLGVSSYGEATESSGEVRLTLDAAAPLAGRHVLIVEDIVDTGLTLAYIQKLVSSRDPASVRTVVLLDKPSRRQTDVELTWVGFTIPDRFVFGYGLDGPGGLCRNLPDIVAHPSESDE